MENWQTLRAGVELGLENKNEPEVFLDKVFLKPPQVMDVRAFGSRTSMQKTLFSCAPSDGVKVLGPGRPPGCPPGRPRDITPKNFMFRLLFPSLRIVRGDLLTWKLHKISEVIFETPPKIPFKTSIKITS